MIGVAFISGKLKIVNSPTNKWVYGLLALHFILAPFAFNSGYAVDQGIEYTKMVVLYLLMLTVADDEESLKALVKVYVFSMMIYELHSLWEYSNGRHDFKMGITRMIGVDRTFNDPNAFGGSIVLSLPFVYALFRSEANMLLRTFYCVYFALTVLCVIQTGSRSSTIALVFLLLLWSILQRGKIKILMIAICIISMVAVWIIMPDQKRDRIRSLWDEKAGTAGAHMSAEGRIIGWEVSWRMFKLNPFTGVGAGGENFIGYRIANELDEEGQKAPLQAHVLYGEVLAEFGLVGAILFTLMVVAIWRSCLLARTRLITLGLNLGFLYMLGGAIVTCLSLLLLLGFSGHNFYRPLWLWCAAWSGNLLRISTREPCDFSD